MMTYQTKISDGTVDKYYTVDGTDPQYAIKKAIDMWVHSGGAPITEKAVYSYEEDDFTYNYQWAPPDTFKKRKNLLGEEVVAREIFIKEKDDEENNEYDYLIKSIRLYYENIVDTLKYDCSKDLKTRIFSDIFKFIQSSHKLAIKLKREESKRTYK